MDIITAYATKNDCYKANQTMMPIGIVLHSTGANNPNLAAYPRYAEGMAAAGMGLFQLQQIVHLKFYNGHVRLRQTKFT